MKITARRIWCAVLATGTLALVTVLALAQGGGQARGGQAGANAPPADRFVDIKITTTKITDHVYALEASRDRPLTRARFGFQTGPDGILMVDSYYGQVIDMSMAAIRKVSDGPIRYMVNTHGHPDQPGRRR